VERLTRDEMIMLVERLVRGEGEDEQTSEWIGQFERSLPHQAISDLISYPRRAGRTSPLNRSWTRR
jgi:hypothetical protein